VFAVAIGAAAVALWAAFVYLGREQLGIAGLGLAALRTTGVTALLILLFNPVRSSRVAGGPLIVLLDESLSMGVVGGRWEDALDSARTLAGTDGVILRFGSSVNPFDSTAPSAGASRLRDALLAARAAGGPVYVVTDGELEDLGAIHPETLAGVEFALLVRDTVSNAALLDVGVPDVAQHEDSLEISLTIGTWGSSLSDSARVEIWTGDRRLHVGTLRLPPSPGTGRRSVVTAPGTLPVGTHVLRVRLITQGDSIVGDNERLRLVTVTEQPGIVVLADPAGWEARFLMTELAGVSRATVLGFGHVSPGRWIDMRSLGSVGNAVVRDNAMRAGVLVICGTDDFGFGDERPVWHWVVGDTTADVLSGEWYVLADIPPSPFARELGRVDWSSLPPLTGLVANVLGDSDWVALSARLGRRGAERPVLVGMPAVRSRQLRTNASGLWRWAFRGGAEREAYRTLLATGIDWLLESEVVGRRPALSASPFVSRGEPVVFRWAGDSIPESVPVVIERLGESMSDSATLRFDASGSAVYHLQTGVYRWRTLVGMAADGLTVVEEYSEELTPRAVVAERGTDAEGMRLVERFARQNWWLFVIVVFALCVEWGWRYRKGLP
jgi:hypothetical protein